MKFASFFLIFLTFCSSVKADVMIHVRDDTGFTDALENGDTQKIQTLINSATDPKQKELFLAGKLRIESDLDASTAHAKECYDADAVAGKSPLAMLCGLIIAGNALNQGDIATWARLTDYIKEKTLPKYMRYTDDAIKAKSSTNSEPLNKVEHENYSIDLFSFVKDYTQFKNWPYKTKVTESASYPGSIPIDWQGTIIQGRSSLRPFIQIEINGTRIKGLIDTGTGGNLYLDKKTALSLGINHLTPGWSPLAYLGGREQNSLLANASTVNIGNKLFQNIPVIISDTSEVPVTIGMNMLRQLEGVSLSVKQFKILSLTAPICSEHMAIGSPLAGSIGWMLFPVIVNGNHVNSIIDTGAPMLLYEMRDKIPSPYSAEKNSASAKKLQPMMPYQNIRGNFDIAGKHYSDKTYPVFQQAGIFHYGVGAWLLRHNIVTMDFKHGYLCVDSSNQQ